MNKQEHHKKFILTRELKKSRSKNDLEIRNDIKKHSSFIIKHKSFGSFSKNQSKEKLDLFKMNK